MTAAWDFNKDETESDFDDSDNDFELRINKDGEESNDEL
jgi:hypothetical protein